MEYDKYIIIVNNKSNVQLENVEDLVRNIKWKSISLDGLLDFILSESKLLINSSELQGIVISEFSRRFREEYTVDSPKRKMSNMNNSNANTTSNFKTPITFTADLIGKLISKHLLYNPFRNCF